MNKKDWKKIICYIIKHDWLYLDGLYVGEFDGKWCMRCEVIHLQYLQRD